MVAAMARLRAPATSPAAAPSGAQSVRAPSSTAVPPSDDAKWDSGSDTPKYISPMPMPAANSIANQPG